MSILTLLRQGNPLADVERQRDLLEGSHDKNLPQFQSVLTENGFPTLQRGKLNTLQVNVGKLCNQTCRHCHVDAGPDRRELMNRENFEPTRTKVNAPKKGRVEGACWAGHGTWIAYSIAAAGRKAGVQRAAMN